MDFITLVQTRQSCRNFDPDQNVSQEEISACLEAARLAPSACNAQPMRFIVCTGESARPTAACIHSLGLNGFVKNVPCFIIVSEGNYNVTSACGSRIKGQDFRSIDIGIAVAHLTLAAAERGLSTCILGWFDEKKLQKLLKINKRIRLVIALGRARDKDALRPKVRKPMEDLVDFR